MRSEKPSVSASRSAASEFLQVVSFKVGEEEFGIEILSVQEIIRLQELTRQGTTATARVTAAAGVGADGLGGVVGARAPGHVHR